LAEDGLHGVTTRRVETRILLEGSARVVRGWTLFSKEELSYGLGLLSALGGRRT
jgi:hypothetical protein